MLAHNLRDVPQFLPIYIKYTKDNTLPLHHRSGHCRQGEGERGYQSGIKATGGIVKEADADGKQERCC